MFLRSHVSMASPRGAILRQNKKPAVTGTVSFRGSTLVFFPVDRLRPLGKDFFTPLTPVARPPTCTRSPHPLSLRGRGMGCEILSGSGSEVVFAVDSAREFQPCSLLWPPSISRYSSSSTPFSIRLIASIAPGSRQEATGGWPAFGDLAIVQSGKDLKAPSCLVAPHSPAETVTAGLVRLQTSRMYARRFSMRRRGCRMPVAGGAETPLFETHGIWRRVDAVGSKPCAGVDPGLMNLSYCVFA
jgi:hypothetical protein